MLPNSMCCVHNKSVMGGRQMLAFISQAISSLLHMPAPKCWHWMWMDLITPIKSAEPAAHAHLAVYAVGGDCWHRANHVAGVYVLDVGFLAVLLDLVAQPHAAVDQDGVAARIARVLARRQDVLR